MTAAALLLSTGFHTGVDIAAAVVPHPAAVAALPLGPHEALVPALRDRLAALSGGDRSHRDLVARNDILACHDAGPIEPDHAPRRHGIEQQGDVVVAIDPDGAGGSLAGHRPQIDRCQRWHNVASVG